MSLVEFPDGGGHPISLQDIDGFLLDQEMSVDLIRGIKKFEFRSDDTLIISYPKSGCHWIWEIARMLVDGTTDIYIQEKDDFMMEFRTVEFMDKFPPPRILNNHLLSKHQSPDLVEKKVKTILVYRNPKDVAVSFYHHHYKIPDYKYKGKFHDYLSLFMEGKVDCGDSFDWLRDWETMIAKNPDHLWHIVSYEDMKEDLPREVKRLSSFLGKNYDDSFYKSVAEKCGFKEMKNRKKGIFNDDKGEPIMYRKGEVGDWKNWFTVAQSEQLDQIHAKKMKGSRFKFRYTIDNSEMNES